MLFDVLRGFVDRTRELTLFHRMLTGEIDERVLLILEPGEIGKTCFLLKLADECEKQRPPVPVALLDFDERRSGLTDYLSVAREVRRCLGDEQTPAICACEDDMYRRGPLVSIRTGEGEAGVDWGRRGRFTEADISDVTGRDRIQIGSVSEAARTEDQIAWQKAEMGRALCRDLASLTKAHRRAVLLVDTFEDASEQTRAWLEQWIFSALRRELSRLLLVVAGRPQCRPFFEQPRLWSGLVAPLRFDPFTNDDILTHYRLRGLTVSEAETSLLTIARLSPAMMAQLGDRLEQIRGGAR